MMKLLFLMLLAVPAWCQCTIQTINSSDPVSTGPAKLNANFASLNTCKPQRFTGTTVPGSITGSLRGDLYTNTATNLSYQCFGAGPCTTVAAGNWVCLNCSSGGAGTVTVVGSGNLGSTQCVTGGGLQTAQTPSANCTVDAIGNLIANSFSSGDTSHSGGSYYQGLTSGGVMLAAADVAGTAIVYVLPSTNGVSGQFLKDNGVVACPTLATGSPSVCHQLTWAAGGGGSGCSVSGTPGQILIVNGAGTGCDPATPTISGSTITASLTGHASLDAPLASPTFTGTVTIPNGAVLGTPTSMTATNVTGLPLTTGITGVLPTANIAVALANQTSVHGITAGTAAGDSVFGQIIAHGTKALDFASTGTGACATVITDTATGVDAAKDVIFFSTNASIKAVTGYVPASTGGGSINAFPSSNTANFEWCNWTAGTVDPGSITVLWIAVRMVP